MRKQFPIFCLLLACTLSLITRTVSPSALAQQTTEAQAAPSQSKEATLNLAGLRERVTVRRDERGIPYIEAANDADLYFAQGYITASERLWQMDLMRRSARGELSEIFGKSVLEEDKRHRIYGFGRLTEAMVGQLSPTSRSSMEAYARGVNALIESLDAKTLPVEFQILQYKPRPWTPADTLLIGKTFAESLSTTWRTDLMRALMADLPASKREFLLNQSSPLDVVLIGTDNTSQPKAGKASGSTRAVTFQTKTLEMLQEIAAIEQADERSLARLGLSSENRAVSNNWVVSGAHTTTGKPLLANDPHLSPSAPSIWYMISLRAPGIHVSGVTAPGTPGIVLGHNEQIAWGATNLGPDVQDLYLEKFDASNPRKYMTPSGWQEAEVRHEEIKVRKSPVETATETVPLDVTITRHGPIVFENNGARFALRWTALDPQANEFEFIYKLNRAHNWNDFRQAFNNYPGPTQNFIFADTAGHIGYYGAGRIPVRKSGDGSLPYDGSTDAGEWSSFIPFDKLPQLYDPPSGIIVTANQRIAGRSYPYFLSNEWTMPYRARRILDLLQAKPKLSIEDFQAIEGDTFSYAADRFAREAVKIVKQSPSKPEGDEKWLETWRLIESWDGHMSADSRPALLASMIRLNLRKRVLAAALGPDLVKEYTNSAFLPFFLDRIIIERPAEWLPKEFKNYGELLRASYEDARADIAKTIGADESQWTWGRYSTMRFPHPLAAVPLIGQQFAIQPLPQNGSGSSINVGSSVSMRFIADTSNWDETRQGIALGESGNPSSSHWKDQLADWRAVTPRIFPFTDAAVNKATQATLVLMPARSAQ